MGIWDNQNLSTFERFDKITEHVSKIGNKVTVVGEDDGNLVEADRIAKALKDKGVKGIKPGDSIVIVVSMKDKKYELWVKSKNYTALRQLKEIRDDNGGTLKGAKFTIEKVSEGDPEKSTYEFAKA